MSSAENSENPWPKVDTSSADSLKLDFEDKFVKTTTFKPLDDSETYLASLERKLHALKNDKSGREKETVLETRKTWDSCMYRLITGGSREKLNINQDQELERGVTPNLLRSWINPEQPVTVGEVTALLKHDSVALNAASCVESNN